MNYTKRNCDICANEYSVLTKELKRGQGFTCSRICGNKSKSNKLKQKIIPNVSCGNCNAPLYKNTSKLKNSKHGFYFCNRKCKDSVQKTGKIPEILPPHYGKCTSVTSAVYRSIAFKAHPNECSRCSFSDVRILVVHHKDRNRLNNITNNLEIMCPNCHALEHYISRNTAS